MKKSVALLDLDAQGSLEDWSKARGEHEQEVMTSKISPNDVDKAFERLEGAGADVIIADTSPRAASTQMGLARLADLILIPCQTTRFDVQGLAQTYEILRTIPKAIEKARLVVTRAPTNLSSKSEIWQVADHVKATYGIEMIASLGNRVTWQRASNFGLDVGEVAPGSKAAKELDYLVRQIMKGRK
jgi:chromosome partitioning protein